MATADLTPEDIAAALAARRELGADFEPEIAASLADKIEREIALRTAANTALVEARSADKQAEQRHRTDSNTVLAVFSLIFGIPITAIAAGTSHGNVAAIGIAWLGISVVNVAHALGRRHNR